MLVVNAFLYNDTLKKTTTNIWDIFEILAYAFEILIQTPPASKETLGSAQSKQLQKRKDKINTSQNGPNMIIYIFAGCVKNLLLKIYNNQQIPMNIYEYDIHNKF